MIGGFKTVSLAWVNKIAVIGYPWLFVYESFHSYKEGMHVPPTSLRAAHRLREVIRLGWGGGGLGGHSPTSRYLTFIR